MEGHKLELTYENLDKGYYLIRGLVKSERALCSAQLMLIYNNKQESYTLPIPRSGKINHIVKVKEGLKKLIVSIPTTPNTEIKQNVVVKKLSLIETLYHFYRRVFGVIFSKDALTQRMKKTLRLNLFKPEESYYKVSYARHKRICGSKSKAEWLENYRKVEERYWSKIQKPKSPSLLLIVLKDDGKSLEKTMNSVRQSVCIPDRILVCSRTSVGSFLEKASEDYVLFLEEGEVLEKYAVCLFKEWVNRKGRHDVFYADHYHLSGEDVEEILLKPDWSIDYFLEYDYVKAPVFYRRDLLRIKEFTSNYEILLELLKEKKDLSISHIPSPMLGRQEKENRYEQKLEKLKEYLGGRGLVYPSKKPHTFRVVYPIDRYPKVSIVIPTKDKAELIKGCITSLLQLTDYPDYEVLIVDNGSKEEEVLRFYEDLKKDQRIKVLTLDIPFNFSKLINFGVSKAEGEVVCLLNNDTKVIQKDWLKEMVMHCMREEVGVVGAKLLYPDGTIQHGGVIMGIWNGTDHAFKGVRDGDGYMFRLSTVQNYLAVTAACMAFRKSIFQEFDESFEVDFNDVDFCLRVLEKGYRILWTPYSALIHLESKTKTKDKKRSKREVERLRKKWAKYIQRDPYYNPNLTLYDTNFSLNPYPTYCLE